MFGPGGSVQLALQLRRSSMPTTLFQSLLVRFAPAPEPWRTLRRGLRRSNRAGASPEERALAHALRQLRIDIAISLGARRCCGGCAAGYPLPHGTFSGGFCCGGTTGGVFSEEELAALALGGTRARHLRRWRDAPAGCIFRGPHGCALEPADRPNACVSHLCPALQRELHTLGLLDTIEARCDELRGRFATFVALRQRRIDDASLNG